MTDLAPVSVITGFLGSGKTTLLNRLLQQPAMRGAAVIVNEFGDIGIDHLLVESAIEDAVLLRSGCICCTVRGDLVDTLDSLRERRARGAIPAFDRVMVETTGLADPAPILQTLMSDATLTPHYRLGAVVATADAVNAPGQLDRFDEAIKQIALADRLVVTKTDLVPAAAAEAVIARLRTLNDAAPIIRLPDDAVTPDRLFDASLFDPRGQPPDIARWLGPHEHGHGHADHAHTGHDSAIRSFCLTRDAPVPWPAFKAWLESVVSLRGADLLRLKGIVNVAGEDRPVVVHGVQHVFHPPTRLPCWPDADRRTRLVFITRNIEPAPLERALAAFVARAANQRS
jgi:G3E family GTPase